MARGIPWKSEDEARLEALIRAGLTTNEIASRMERTPGQIDNKITRMDLRSVRGVPLEEPVTFEVDELPDEMPTAEELLAQRERQFGRTAKAKAARRLIPVRVKIRGEFGIMHMGDSHLDDNGTDIAKVRRHVEVARNTEGLLVGNVGDLQNNWVGRLAHLYGQQSLSAKEAWVLVEWMVKALPWLYIIGGNHDIWSGAGDPLKWIAKHAGSLYEPNGARMGLNLPCGREIRLNARHNWPGHSQWNAAHGVGKAVQMGWRDHIVTCGHTHVSGFMPLKDPSSGLISHAIQVASYKTYDKYAEERALRDQTVFMAPVTIVSPQYADDDPRLLTTIFDPEEACEYLTWKRYRRTSMAA